MTDQALTGLKVIEYANMVSGPYCGKLLADLGAEVIKIEEPYRGDDARRCEPFANNIPGIERSGFFAYLNTNKKSITLNLDSIKGKEIFKELIRESDILIENHPPKWIDEIGIKYEILEKVNPQLIMTSITPFGQTGPYKDYEAYELNTYCGSPFGALSTAALEEPVNKPIKGGGRQSEFMGAQAAAVATMCAVISRKKIGEGQHIDIALQELMTGQCEAAIEHWTFAENEMVGVMHPVITPIMPFPCKDGWVFLHFAEDHQYDSFVELMGNPDWNDKELFGDRFKRADYVDALVPLISEWTMQFTKEELFKMSQAVHAPVGPSYTSEEVVNSPHLSDRKYFIEIEHPEIGLAKYPGAPYRLSLTPWKINCHAPLLGEHNELIYSGRMGYTKQDFIKLTQMNII